MYRLVREQQRKQDMAKTRDYMDYLDEQIEIAPANSQEEYQAAETIAEVLRDHDLETSIEEFDTHPMGTMVMPVLALVMFVCLIVAGLTDGAVRIIAILMSVLCAALPLLRHYIGLNLFENFGPASQSQNVVAVHRATGSKVVKGARPIVVVAHYDTPRESLLHRQPIARYQSMVRTVSIPCLIAVAVSLFFQILLFLPGFIRTFMWVVGIMASLPLVVLAVIDVIDHFAPCTTGSNDNKSSVAALLSIANKVRPTGDRVDGDFEKSQSRPSRRRANDPVEELPTSHTVEVVEEVKGVRHGADVLHALGILPPSCEIVYQEPRVQVVEQIATEVLGTDASPDDIVDLDDVQDVTLEQTDETLTDDEESAIVEDIPSQIEHDDETADTDEELDYEEDESWEDEDEDSYEDDFEDADTYDEEDYEEEDYEDAEEYEDDEDWEGTGALSSIGSWFSDRISNVREYFSKDRGSDIDIDRGADRRAADDEPSEYDAWLDDYDDEDSEDISYEDEEHETYDYEEDEEVVAEEETEQLDAESDEGPDKGDVEKRLSPIAVPDIEDDTDLASDVDVDDDVVEGDENEEVETEEVSSDLEEEVFEEEYDDLNEEIEVADYDVPAEDIEEEAHEEEIVSEEDEEEDVELTEEDEYEDFEYDEDEYTEDEYDTDEVEGDFEEEAHDEEQEEEYVERPSIGQRIAGFFKKLRAQPQDDEPYGLDDLYYDDEEDIYEQDEYEEVYEESDLYEDDSDESIEYVEEDFEYEDENDFVEDDVIEEEDEEEYEDDVLGEEDDYEEYEEYEEYVEYVDEYEEDEILEDFEDEEPYEDALEDEEDDYVHVMEDDVESRMLDDEYSDEDEDEYEYDLEEDYFDDEFVEADLEFEDEITYDDETPSQPAEPLSDPNVLHFDREEDPDIVPRDDSGLNTISDSYDLYTGEVSRVSARKKPAPLDDPAWGVSTYQPSKPVMNIARRAALFDLPDPSAASMDPFEDEPYKDEYEDDYEDGYKTSYEDYEENLDDIDEFDDVDEPLVNDLDQDTDPEPLAKDIVEQDSKGSTQTKFWGASRSPGWKGGATMRADLMDDQGDEPIVMDMDELQDAILELGDEFLVAHDIWFVATGASEVGHAGMRAFIDEHRRDIRGAFLVNLDSIGAGALSLLVREGLHEPRRADRRLVRTITSIAQDLHVQMDTAMYNWDERESATSMRSRVRSVTMVGLDDNNLPALSHTSEDVPENVDPSQVSDVVRIVCELIRRA